MRRNRVIGHLLNPHMPSLDKKTGERNIFFITEDGQVSQFMDTKRGSVRNLERVPFLRIPSWWRDKQIKMGWIPVTITSRGEVIE